MLRSFDGEWPRVVRSLLPEIHEEDRDALAIWFATYPLVLEELASDETFFQLRGDYRPSEASHALLRGHRYWRQVKSALKAAGEPEELAKAIRDVAERSGAPIDFALGLSAIGWMMLRQCGAGFLNSGYEARAGPIINARATAYAPGLVDRLKGKRSSERVIFDEGKAGAWFPILPAQEITSAAEADKRAFHLEDERCYEGMGAIPVDCRSGSCGTCWVGILGGNRNLDPVEEFERKRMAYFGYWDSGFVETAGERPLLRLACQVRANGSVSIAIPKWNGVFGESRRKRERIG